MKKRTIIPLMLLLPSLQAVSAPEDKHLEITYFAVATHKPFLDEDKYRVNNKLNMFSVAYRDSVHGFELSTFTNSYFNQSVALSYARYWNPWDSIETSIHVGGVTGYPDNPALLVTSVAYTKYDLFVPKVSWFGEALMFSLSFKVRF